MSIPKGYHIPLRGRHPHHFDYCSVEEEEEEELQPLAYILDAAACCINIEIDAVPFGTR